MIAVDTDPTVAPVSPSLKRMATMLSESDIVARSGVRLRIRPANSGDEARLAQLFNALPPEDLRHRFLAALREVGPERVRQMVASDDPNIVNFLAIDEASGAIVATAMLAADEAQSEGEFALSTHPDWKEKGVGWSLLAFLADFAREAGLEIIKSIETRDDEQALQLEREMGFRVKPVPDDATLMIAEKRLR